MIKLKNATFAQAVRLQNNRMENFVTAEQAQFELFYKPEEQLLYVYHASGVIKLVGITNIVEMTLEQAEEKKSRKQA
jgi:hypothetical protein